ncbi:hypothetical protein [Sphingobacterium siyangense]|uniref:hypothetical protein n=1 Tax=Sphingobacterium siyangense TaxID=459529 RepID=UPI0031FA04B3
MKIHVFLINYFLAIFVLIHPNFRKINSIGSEVEGHLPEEVFLNYQYGTKPIAPVAQQVADLLKRGQYLGYIMSIRKLIG